MDPARRLAGAMRGDIYVKLAARRAVVIGTGLIGGSLAVAGRRARVLGEVLGVGRNRRNLDIAISKGLVDAVSQDARAAVGQADLVILATPVETAAELLGKLAALAPPGCVFTDVGSVKAPICRAAVEAGIEDRFVGGHPLAGSECRGAEHADPSLFEGCVVVLTRGPRVRAAARARVERLWRGVGARIVQMDAAAHDRAVAVSSHLPQMLAFCLAATAASSEASRDVRRLRARGFDDMTRLASSDPRMWEQIIHLNEEAVLQALDCFTEICGQMRRAIAAGDRATLRRLMKAARQFERGSETG